MSFLNKILLNCNDATLLICKNQENVLTFKEKIQLRFHLLICKFCSLFYKQSDYVHHKLKKMSAVNYESNILQLDETKKTALQLQLDAESEK